jgi:hypothetical protein
MINEEGIEMQVLGSDNLTQNEKSSGFWFELRDNDGQSVYSQILHDPLMIDAELPSEKNEGKFTRVRVDNPEGTFTILVPDTYLARNLIIFSNPLPSDRLSELAKEHHFQLMSHFTRKETS